MLDVVTFVTSAQLLFGTSLVRVLKWYARNRIVTACDTSIHIYPDVTVFAWQACQKGASFWFMFWDGKIKPGIIVYPTANKTEIIKEND